MNAMSTSPRRIAINTGDALVPFVIREIPYHLDRVCEKLAERYGRRRDFAIVVQRNRVVREMTLQV
jgi:hypothetical protein